MNIIITLITIIIFSAISFFFWFFLLKKEHGRIIASLDNIFIICFQSIYCILFPIIFYLTIKGFNSVEYTAVIKSYNPSDIFLYYFCLNIFLVLFTYAFRYNRKNDYYTPRNIIHTNIASDSNHTLLVSVSFLLVIGCICNFLFYRAYGGYFGYLPYATIVRAGVVAVNNPFTFLSPLRGCIGIACSVSFVAMIKTKKNFLPFLIIFLVSFALTLMNMYANRGRLSIIRFFVCLIIVFAFTSNKDYRISFKIFCFTLFLGIFSIVLLNYVGTVMGRNSDESFINAMCFELSFPFVSFKLEIANMNLGSYRYFTDIFFFFLYFLPTRFWVNVVNYTASQVNTNFFSGAYKTTGGEIPVDIISFSYMQGNILGIIVISLLAGFVFRWIYKAITRIKSLELKSLLFVYLFINFMVNDIFYADTKDIAQRAFPLLLLLVIYQIATIVRRNRKAEHLAVRI